jgi:transposase
MIEAVRWGAPSPATLRSQGRLQPRADHSSPATFCDTVRPRPYSEVIPGGLGAKQAAASTFRSKDEEASLQQRVQVPAVKLSSHLGIETHEVVAALNIHPFMLSRWKKEFRERNLSGKGQPSLKEMRGMENAVAGYRRIRELEAALKKAMIEKWDSHSRIIVPTRDWTCSCRAPSIPMASVASVPRSPRLRESRPWAYLC